jgi:bifunctional DNA-binding transcriptional regulator/antitoxin component of YhaV-PrlF toxin-antitoxin module
VEVRRALRLEPGDRVVFVEDGKAFRLLPANAPVTTLKGLVAKPSAPVGLEDIDKAVRRARAKANARGRK